MAGEVWSSACLQWAKELFTFKLLPPDRRQQAGERGELVSPFLGSLKGRRRAPKEELCLWRHKTKLARGLREGAVSASGQLTDV